MLLWEWVPWHWDCIYSIGQPKVKNRRNSNFWNYITCPPSHRWKLNIKAAAVLWNLVVQQLSSWTSAPFPLEILHLTVMFNLIRNQYEQIMEKFIFTKLKLQHGFNQCCPTTTFSWCWFFLSLLKCKLPSSLEWPASSSLACSYFNSFIVPFNNQLTWVQEATSIWFLVLSLWILQLLLFLYDMWDCAPIYAVSFWWLWHDIGAGLF